MPSSSIRQLFDFSYALEMQLNNIKYYDYLFHISSIAFERMHPYQARFLPPAWHSHKGIFL
jgi:hypothetical protein